MEYLTRAFRDPDMDYRHKLVAANGIIDYHLAAEIAGLIDILTRIYPLPPVDIRSIPGVPE